MTSREIKVFVIVLVFSVLAIIFTTFLNVAYTFALVIIEVAILGAMIIYGIDKIYAKARRNEEELAKIKSLLENKEK